ncbi:MAG TPA: hypothetical protein DD420_35275 [Streptomyces sp.]|nr:hypothetical protein [Streptomyces sp.]
MTEAEWRRLELLLPAGDNRCGRWRDHRQGANGSLHRERTGSQWRDLPERFGPWRTVYECHRRWSAGETWKRLLQVPPAQANAVSGIDWDVSVDLTSIRAHQHEAGARKARLPRMEPNDPERLPPQRTAPAFEKVGAVRAPRLTGGERAAQVCRRLPVMRR